MNCVCMNGGGAQRPGVQEVIDTLQRSSVCTGTQCFETEADAFGLQAAPSGQPADSSMFFMTMMCAPIFLLFFSARFYSLAECDPSLRFPRLLMLLLLTPFIPRALRFMMFIAMMMKMMKPTRPQLENKPGSSSDHANEPPQPPPVS